MSAFIYMVLKSRDYVFKTSIFTKLFFVLYSVQMVHVVHVYLRIKKLSLPAAVVAIWSITASMLRVSDRWVCSIIRHSSHFSSIAALSTV